PPRGPVSGGGMVHRKSASRVAVPRFGRRAVQLFGALVLLLAFGVPLSAHAMLLPVHDLASLVWQSDAIVRARLLSSRKTENLIDFCTYRVEKVYSGSLSPGDVIEVPDDYQRAPAWGWEDKSPHPASDEVIAFLVKADKRDWKWNIVESGLRISIDGRVQ